ncbi:MAG: hypothetical protein ACRCSG_04050 [Cellulosilyticaceae bacterium]
MVTSPHKNYFDIAKKWNKLYRFIFLGSLFMTIILTLCNNKILDETLITILALVLLVVVEQIVKYYTYKAEETRRKDHLDNSFGKNYIHIQSENYYDTNEINPGPYKMIVNTFECALFSYNISERMRNKILIKNLMVFSVIIILAVIGFSKSSYSILILQLFLSKDYILELIDISIYNNRMKKIFDDLRYLFDGNLKNTNQSVNKHMSEIIRLYSEYETNISDSQLSLDSKIYNELNERLTNEWEEMKKRYNIQ